MRKGIVVLVLIVGAMVAVPAAAQTLDSSAEETCSAHAGILYDLFEALRDGATAGNDDSAELLTPTARIVLQRLRMRVLEFGGSDMEPATLLDELSRIANARGPVEPTPVVRALLEELREGKDPQTAVPSRAVGGFMADVGPEASICDLADQCCDGCTDGICCGGCVDLMIMCLESIVNSGS